MAFETLDIKIKAESGDAESALESVRDSLEDTDAEVEQFDSSLKDAEESTDDLKSSSAALSATLTALNTASSGAQDSVEELGDSAIGAAAGVATLGGSITALEAALVPLVGVLAPVAAGLTAVAGAGGLVVGSGLLAFGEELAANNERRLEQINSRIGRLNALADTEAGLTAQQRETLATLEERRKTVKEQTTATGALAAELSEVKTAFVDAFSDAGEQFVPLVRDGLDALPQLIQDLGDAFENADLSNVTGLLRDIGGAINQNAVGAFETFLELANDTAGGLRRIAENEAVRSFVSDLASAAGDLGSALGEITGDIIDFLESDRADQIFQAINKQVTRLLPDLVVLSENVASIFNTLEENPEATTATINAVGASLNGVVDALNLLLPALEPVIEQIGDAGAAFNDLDSNVQAVITLFTGPFGLINAAVINALASIVPSVDDVASTFDDLKRDVKRAFRDIGTFLTSTAPGIIQSGARGLFDSLVAAAKELKRDLIGNSILKDIFRDFATFLKTTASTLIGNAIDTVVSAIEAPFENIDFSGVIDTLNNIINTAEDALDAVTEVPEVPEIPEVPEVPEVPDEPDTGGGGGRTTNPSDPAGPTDPSPSPGDDNPAGGGGGGGGLDSGFGDGRPDPDPGGGGGGFVGLATGGLIDSGGLAVLHSGERVIPSAEVAERGGGGGVTVNIGEISANSRAEGRQAAKGLKDELKRFDI